MRIGFKQNSNFRNIYISVTKPGETLWETLEMPGETGETLCGTRGNVIGNGRKHVENCSLRGFLRYLVTSSQEDLYRFI